VNRSVGVWHLAGLQPQRTQLLEQHQKLNSILGIFALFATLRLDAKIQFMIVRYPVYKTKKVGTSI
jgi:hypothetical protein